MKIAAGSVSRSRLTRLVMYVDATARGADDDDVVARHGRAPERQVQVP